MPETNGRTHEPTLRELTAEMDGLRELIMAKFDGIKETLNERDRLYKERAEASEKAIVKAEDAQKAYNQNHNDLARKMDEQNKATIPRIEAAARFEQYAKEITELKTAQATGGGATLGGKALKEESRANIAIVIAVISVIGSLVTTAIALVKLGTP